MQMLIPAMHLLHLLYNHTKLIVLLRFISSICNITYTEYAGLEITADSAVALRTGKTAMLVPNCIGGYGGKAVFRPFRVIEAMYQKLIPLFDFLGPKLNFFSFTVCRSEQYLKNGSEKTVLVP